MYGSIKFCCALLLLLLLLCIIFFSLHIYLILVIFCCYYYYFYFQENEILCPMTYSYNGFITSMNCYFKIFCFVLLEKLFYFFFALCFKIKKKTTQENWIGYDDDVREGKYNTIIKIYINYCNFCGVPTSHCIRYMAMDIFFI